MAWHRFLPANAAGAIVWSAMYTTVSYLVGRALQHVSGIVDLVVAVIAVIAVIAVVLVIRRQADRQTDRLADRAERAYPGPLE
jgi:membrane protein DedA with SNARE-associated domain